MANEKESSTKSSVKTFDRTSDKVNSTDFVSLLYDESAIDNYFKNKKVSSKELEQIKRYAALIGKGIERGDGSIQYTINDRGIKGFTNTLGYNNVDEKGNINDKVWGYAVGYAVNKLNNMSAYLEPAKPIDPTKIKYSNNALATLLNRALFNKDGNISDLDIKDFLDLDASEDNLRGLTGRIKRSKDVLNKLRTDYLNQLDDSWTVELKQKLSSNISNLYTLFDNDNTLTDNEFLDFGNYSGIDRDLLRKLYLTDFTKEEKEKEELNKTPRTITDKRRWIRQTYGDPYTGELLDNIDASLSNILFGLDTEKKFATALKNSSSEELINFIDESIFGDGDMQKTSFYKKALPRFKNNNGAMPGYILNRVLTELKNRSNSPLHSFGEGDSRYYIRGINTGNNTTGLVWDGDTINEMSIYKIPYKISEMNNAWNQYSAGEDYDPEDEISLAFPSLKSGGILKADGGTSFNNIYTNDNIDYNTFLNKIFSSQDVINWMQNNFTDLKSYEDFVKTNVDSRYTNGINNYANSDSKSTYTPNEGVRTFNTGYQNSGKTLNYILFGNSPEDYKNKQNGVAYKLTEFNRPEKGASKDSYLGDFKSDYIDDALGLLTYMRVASLTNKDIKNPKDFGEWGKYWASKGANGAYYYTDLNGNGLWIPTNDIKHKSYIPFNFKDPVPANLNDPSPGTAFLYTPITPDIKKITGEDSESFVGGGNPDDKGKGIDWDKIGLYAKDYIPYGINTAMLFDSLRSNRKIENLLRRTPLLESPKNYYHYVTGDFAALQNSNRIADQTLALGSRMAESTANANLGMAALLSANNKANDLRWKGFLADSSEIKRNKDIAEQMATKTMENHIDIANKNMQSLINTDIFNKENTALRILHDQLSRANFGKSMLELYWKNKTDNEAKEEQKNNFSAMLSELDAKNLTDQVMERVNDEYITWEAYKDSSGKLPNKGKSKTLFLSTPEGKKALNWINELNKRNAARRLALYSRIYKTNYEDPFNGDYDINFSRNGSKLIPRNK